MSARLPPTESTSNPPPSQSQAPSAHPPPSEPTTPPTLRIGTRSSALALAQVSLFTTLLSHTHPTLHTTTHPTTTSLGDTNKVTDLHTLASTGKSLWTEDLEKELFEGKIDCVVHSLKDVPTLLPVGCVVRAIGAREESRDAVVLSEQRRKEGVKGGLEALGQGDVVGTSSVRRAAMIRRTYPHLVIKDVRGNVGTRIRKLDDPEQGFDALVLAGAGVQRLGMGERISGWLGRGEGVLHAVGQGALGVEWREGDEWVGGMVARVGEGREGRRVGWEGVAERALLRALEGGCSVPVGVDCEWEDRPTLSDPVSEEQKKGIENEGGEANSEHGGTLTMTAMVVSLDGKECVEGLQQYYVDSNAAAEESAWRLYKQLVDKGAEEILKKIRLNRGMIEGQDGA